MYSALRGSGAHTVPSLQLSQLHRSSSGLAAVQTGGRKSFIELLVQTPSAAQQRPGHGDGGGPAGLPARAALCFIVTKEKFLAGNASSYLYSLFICSFPIAASEITVRISFAVPLWWLSGFLLKT